MKEPKLVRCFGVLDSKVKDVGRKMPIIVPYGPPIKMEVRPSVTIFNDKMHRWETHGLVDYVSKCPVCNDLMRVQAIWGTTWLACCSKKCYDNMSKKANELGELSKAISYYINKDNKNKE